MQLSKEIRIGIIGAGPSGLAAAEALKEKGYHNVVVIEKRDRVGGMSLSKVYKEDGNEVVYEMGSIAPFGSKRLFDLFKRYGVHRGKNNTGLGAVVPAIFRAYSDLEHREVIDSVKHPWFGQKLTLKEKWLLPIDLLKLLKYLFKYRGLSKPGWGGIKKKYFRELSVDVHEWLDAHFAVINRPLKFFSILTALPDENTVGKLPIMLFLKLLFQLLRPPHCYVNSKLIMMREGFQEVWKRMAQQHHVLLSRSITQITRKEKVVVEIDQEGQALFDKLIITCSPKQMLKFLDVDVEEKIIFEKMRYQSFWRVGFLARGIPHDALFCHTKGDKAMNSSHLNHELSGPFLMLFYPEGHVKDDIWLYTGLISLNRGLVAELEQVLQISEQWVREELKGEIIEWVDKAFWNEYAPYFLGTDVKDGIYQKWENLQGNNHTYYLGGAISGSSHATVVEYAYHIVDKFF